jgi:hypothetical protein
MSIHCCSLDHGHSQRVIDEDGWQYSNPRAVDAIAANDGDSRGNDGESAIQRILLVAVDPLREA